MAAGHVGPQGQHQVAGVGVVAAGADQADRSALGGFEEDARHEVRGQGRQEEVVVPRSADPHGRPGGHDREPAGQLLPEDEPSPGQTSSGTGPLSCRARRCPANSVGPNWPPAVRLSSKVMPFMKSSMPPAGGNLRPGGLTRRDAR